MTDQLRIDNNAKRYTIREVKVTTVRECEVTEQPILNDAVLSVGFFRGIVEKSSWFDPDKECAVLMMLDRRNRMKDWALLSLGTQTASLVGMPELFRAVCVSGACAFVLMHNHPSGDPAPSAADIMITRNIREAARIMNIVFTDHVIIGDPKRDPNGIGHYSFREAGII